MSCGSEKLHGLSGPTVSFVEDFKLIAGTLEGGHRAQIHAAGPLGSGELHTECMLITAGAVPGS